MATPKLVRIRISSFPIDHQPARTIFQHYNGINRDHDIDIGPILNYSQFCTHIGEARVHGEYALVRNLARSHHLSSSLYHELSISLFLALKLKNIPHEVKTVNLYGPNRSIEGGEQYKKEFEEMNPIRTVPVLQIDNTTLNDSVSEPISK